MPKVMRSVADPGAEHGFEVEPATYEQAENVASSGLIVGKYWITEDGEVEEEGVVTLSCSGCSCGCEVTVRPVVRMQRVRLHGQTTLLLRKHPAQSPDQRKELRNL